MAGRLPETLPAVHHEGAEYWRNFGTHRARGDGILKRDLSQDYAHACMRAIPVTKLPASMRVEAFEGTTQTEFPKPSRARGEAFNLPFWIIFGPLRACARRWEDSIPEPIVHQLLPSRARCRHKFHRARVRVEEADFISMKTEPPPVRA